MADHLQTVASPQVSNPLPFKKRKVHRRRRPSEDDRDDSDTTPAPPTIAASVPVTTEELISRSSHNADAEIDEEEGKPMSVAEILRQRRGMLRRKGGIEFRNDTTTGKSESSDAQAKNLLLEEEDTFNKIITVVDRFAPQTGQVADVDQHMMAYVDSELAKQRYMHTNQSTLTSKSMGGSSASIIDAIVQRQPAALGKLQEVDLGPDAASLNAVRTEAAKRRLQGGDVELEEPAGKVRLGRDGKPRKPRWRRNSEDLKRDKLVEEVMRESKLDIYDEPEEPHNDDQAADDRIAEQFRREFMDAISQRRQKTTQPTNKKPGPGTIDDKPKGPKLGGSRSARAAMRELQEKAVKK